MIPGADHNSRTVLHRRLSSYAELTVQSGDMTAIAAAAIQAEQEDDLSRPLLPDLEYEEDDHSDERMDPLSGSSVSGRITRPRNVKLWVVFGLLVVSGVTNVIFLKLQSLPMYNYPTFLNLYSNFMYIPISFLYILPVSYFGWFHGAIPRAHLISIPKAPFAVMGALDALAASMQILSSVYLPGTLLVLLPQAAIPLSMLFSRAILHEKFTKWQYIGAAIVFGGILVVLSPVLLQKHVPEYSCQALNLDQDCAICQVETNEEDCLAHLTFDKQSAITFITDGEDTNNSGQTVDCQWVSKDTSLRHDDFLVVVWSLIMVASCVPMVLSSVYKQMALQLPNLDPILVNGWVALFQFLFGIPLAIPAGLVSSPPVSPFGLFHNWKDGFRCLFQQMNAIDYGCHPDHCSQAVLWVHLGLLSAVVYTVSLLFVLKFGGASVLYVGLTVMVPLGHLVFALHSPSSIVLENVIGLAVLLTGLIMYRFGTTELLQDLNNRSSQEGGGGVAGEEDNNQGDDGSKSSYWEFLREPFMLSGDV